MHDDSSSTSPVITFERVTKRYGKTTTALRDVSFSLPRGAVVGLIGRNGSGKSTLLNAVTGLVMPTEGTVTTLGQPAVSLDDSAMARIGAVTQSPAFLEWMRVGEHLEFIGSFHARWDRDRVARLLGVLELDPSQSVARLTPGEQQKLGLVAATAHHPELLLLDEPVSALDPIARERMLAFFVEMLREDGTTIVISSHVLRDVETLVDHLVCLDRGDLLSAGPLDVFLEGFDEWVVERIDGTVPIPEGVPGLIESQVAGRQARLLVDPRVAPAPDGLATGHGLRVVSRRPLNLERAYPALLRREGRMPA